MIRTLAALLAVAATALPALASTASTGPTLVLLDREPLVVRGSAFRPGERVTVTARVFGEGYGRRVMSVTQAGRFTARFDALEIDDACTAYVIRAVGSSGSTASLRRQLPACGALP